MQLAHGNPDISIDEKMCKRDDEIGSMPDSLFFLQNKLKETISDIQQVSDKLVNSEILMEKIVRETSLATGQIEAAAQAVSDDAKSQYDNMNEASEHIDEIGKQISNIVEGVQHLEETSS